MKLKAIILFSFIALTISSCDSKIYISKFIDSRFPLTLTVSKINNGLTETEKKIIEPKSEKFAKLIDWCSNNSSGWKSTFASYNSKVSVTQNNFSLLYLTNGVVINFKDKDGNPKQYSKAIKKGELDFLIKGL